MDAKENFTESTIPPSHQLSDWRLLAILLLAVVPLRAWHIYNTEVVARDCIGYIRYGLEFEKKPWDEVVRSHHQHPGYPIAVWAVSIPVRSIFGLSPESMQFSAQLAGNLAAVLLMFPMFFLGKILFDSRVAFWGTLLFQVMPVGGHLMSDGLSESLFFLLCICSLLYAARSMNWPSVWAFIACGMFGGLAYWTRPEGLLIPFVTGLALVIRQTMPSQRFQWRHFAGYTCGLTASVVVICSPYVWATGSISNKPSLQIILGRLQPVAVEPELRKPVHQPHRLETASLLGEQITHKGNFGRRLSDASVKFLAEIVQALHYIAWLPALLALWWHRKQLKKLPAFWVMLLFCLAQTAILLALGVKAGYVSHRHIMMIVMLASLCAAAGVQSAATRWSERRIARGKPLPWRSAPRLTLMLMLLIFAACLPKSLKSLHRDREGHHAAGMWLADIVKPGDVVEDDHCLVHYYAGMVFREGDVNWQDSRSSSKRYVVMTRSSRRKINEIRRAQEERLRQNDGRIVYHWPPSDTPDSADVVVYAVPKN